MTRRKKIFFRILLIITVLFIVQGRIRDLFSDNQEQFSQLSDSLYVEKTLQKQIESQANVLVPCGWYDSNGKLSPMVAGVCDGAYQAGVAIKDIAVFIAKYSVDKQYRKEVDSDLDVLLENKSEVLSLTGKQFKDWSKELSGAHGSAKAEYTYGKVLFDAMTLVVGTSEIGALSKAAKNAKILKALKSIPLAKLANIKKVCPPCAAIFKAAQTLREDLLVTNLAATRKLLEADFVKSGKAWEVFIKDYEAHHIIPVNMLDESKGLQFYYNNGGTLKFNSLENGIMLKKVSKEGLHAKHQAYSFEIKEKLVERLEKIRTSNVTTTKKISMMDKELRKIIEDTRELILEKGINGSTKINQLFQ